MTLDELAFYLFHDLVGLKIEYIGSQQFRVDHNNNNLDTDTLVSIFQERNCKVRDSWAGIFTVIYRG